MLVVKQAASPTLVGFDTDAIDDEMSLGGADQIGSLVARQRIVSTPTSSLPVWRAAYPPSPLCVCRP